MEDSDRRKKTWKRQEEEDMQEVDDDLNVAENHFLDVASGEVPSKSKHSLFYFLILYVLFLFFIFLS